MASCFLSLTDFLSAVQYTSALLRISQFRTFYAGLLAQSFHWIWLKSMAFFFKMQKAFSHHCLICIIILERLLLVLRLTWKRCFFFDFHFLTLWQVVLGVLESTTKECFLGTVNIQIWMLCKTSIIYILWHPPPQFLFPELRQQKFLMINMLFWIRGHYL